MTYTQLKALLQAIRSDPFDGLPAATIADWYEDQGNEVRARAWRMMARGEVVIRRDSRMPYGTGGSWDLFLPSRLAEPSDLKDFFLTDLTADLINTYEQGSPQGEQLIYLAVLKKCRGTVRALYRNPLRLQRALYRVLETQ